MTLRWFGQLHQPDIGFWDHFESDWMGAWVPIFDISTELDYDEYIPNDMGEVEWCLRSEHQSLVPYDWEYRYDPPFDVDQWWGTSWTCASSG